MSHSAAHSNATPTTRAIGALNELWGLSQEEIAQRLGVSFTSVNAWSSGKRTPRPQTQSTISALVAVLASSPDTSAAARKDLLRTTLVLLESRYVPCEDQTDPLDLLFRLLLQLKGSSSDTRAAFEHLKARFSPWKGLATASAEDVESHMKSGGFGSIKAQALIDVARRIVQDFGKVDLRSLTKKSDETVEEYLRSLPGVGQRVARLVMLYGLRRDVVPMDADSYRTAVRVGLVPTSTSTASAHRAIDKVVPKSLALPVHASLVALSRDCCHDPVPACKGCVLKAVCGYAQSHTAAQEPPRTTERAKLPSSGKLVAIDLYSGCGGLSLGLHDAGFNVAYSTDWWDHACATHSHSLPHGVVECRDIREISGRHVESVVGGKVDLVAGGPNCQGVSERGLRNPDDPRNFMFPEFVRLVKELRPRAFLMENVPGLAHRHNFEILRRIFGSFEALGYDCGADVLLAANFGVPQLRYRFFMIGTLDGTPISLPVPTHVDLREGGLFSRPFVNVWEAIGDLPDIDAHRQDDSPLPYPDGTVSGEFSRYVRKGSGSVWNHCVSATEQINLDRARHIPEGGNWKDIPPGLLPPRFFRCRMTDHSTTYARLRREKPAYTITALFGNITAGAFTHPLANRALSVREGARLQSFPDSFHFCGPRNSQYRQIGNAVPPLLGRAVAEHLRKLLQGERTAATSPRITRETLESERSWDALPILTPRFKDNFGTGTRWPIGWGTEPKSLSSRLDNNYSLRPEFYPPELRSAILSSHRSRPKSAAADDQ
jgi:DNA (cytosine-5)-methyltransferase 1